MAFSIGSVYVKKGTKSYLTALENRFKRYKINKGEHPTAESMANSAVRAVIRHRDEKDVCDLANEILRYISETDGYDIAAMYREVLILHGCFDKISV